MMWTVVVGCAVMAAALYRLSAPRSAILEPMQDPTRTAVGLLAPSSPTLDRLPAARTH
jgi:hypothetical protein